MSTESPGETYALRLAQAERAIGRHSQNMNILSVLRLGALVLSIYLVFPGTRLQEPLFYVGSALLFMLFLFLVTRYNRESERRKLQRELKALNETEKECLAHRYDSLPDGSEFTDHAHAWSHDLDLFGKGSLYQYINRTGTREGSRILAGMLTREPGGHREVVQRQAMTGDLTPRLGFRQHLVARGRLIRQEPGDLDGIRKWLAQDSYISRRKWLVTLAGIMGSLSLAILVYGIFQPSGFRFLLPVLLINFSILSPFLMQNNRYHQSISRKHDLLQGFSRLLQIIASEPFRESSLAGKGAIAGSGTREIRRLSRMLELFDQRLNMLLGAVFNGLFLFDFLMLHLLERWKTRNREMVMEWIGITGWMDAMASLAGFAFNHPDYVKPVLSGETEPMEVKGLGHPLIDPGRRVDNDLSIDGETVVIITGANMAGKSTFLRALGVNLVLAYTGCPVCARTFRSGYMGLCSSMRTADSLADSESYFLAEIRKLQHIVRRMETGEPLLILLDEVLKGTNTTDKRKGSVGLIRRALPYPVRCFIATHDLSLGEMEEELPGQVVNYCFESYIRDLELEFDYTIRRGIATNMNASFLMKKMGITG